MCKPSKTGQPAVFGCAGPKSAYTPAQGASLKSGASVAGPLTSMTRLLAGLCICLFLGACATSPPAGRAQLTAPKAVSEVYSDLNIKLMLATTPDAERSCADPACAARTQFDRRVAHVGGLLADAANHLYPDLRGRIERFEFAVADKAEPGTASTASGRVIVLRPVSTIAPNDEALGFIMGREIGHVVAQHHDENAAAGFIVSAMAQVFAPLLNFARAIATIVSSISAAGATSSTATNVAMAAASIAGSRVLVSAYKPQQRVEADAIAVDLLAHIGYDARSISTAFASVDLGSQPTNWVLDLRNSVNRLAASVPAATAAAPEALVLAR